MVRRRQCSSERNRESKPAPDRGREGIHGGREREEESLRVQDAGNGGAEVRLTFLPHGPPAAALIFRIREAHLCPYLEYWLARQRARSQCTLLGVEKR